MRDEPQERTTPLDIAAQRKTLEGLRQITEENPNLKMAFNGRTYTMQQIVHEVEQRTPAGVRFAERYLEDLEENPAENPGPATVGQKIRARLNRVLERFRP